MATDLQLQLHLGVVSGTSGSNSATAAANAPDDAMDAEIGMYDHTSRSKIS